MALPLSIVLYRYTKFSKAILYLVGLLQTVPSIIGFPAKDFDLTNINHRIIRFYIGLEDPDYLIADLKKALDSY